MEVKSTEPPDGGGFEKKERGGPSLPSTLAAAVSASQHEGREAQPTGGHQQGEGLVRTETAAAARVVQAKGAGGPGALETAQDVLMVEAGEAQNEVPLDSLVSVVLTGHGRSKGEVALPGEKNPGDQPGEKDNGAARIIPQVEDASQTGMEEGQVENRWEIAGRRKNKGITGNQSLSFSRKETFVYEEREGDWSCKSRGCENFLNFKRRTHCMRCRRDKKGEMAPVQEAQEGVRRETWTPGARYRERTEERGQLILRQPKLSVVVVNVTIEGKDNIKLQEEDHYEVMKQAGLNVGEVRGKFAKPGYLEVGMITGATSIPRALREHPKEVNKRIMITSVRERGINRPILMRWAEVPFMIPDETIINYQQLFAKSEGGGKSMRWERSREEDDKSPGGELVGSFTAERTCRATLNSNITHIPTWHYIGGARIKLIVPGRKNCGHCLKSVGECESGGVWSRCKDKKTPRGNWKDDVEQFLRTQCDGWDDKKQKEMESLEKKDVEAATAGDDEEAEFRMEEERLQLEEEAKEGLVQQVAEDKICGALLLRDLPEGDGNKIRVAEEVLLTIIYASKLEGQEAERMRKAEVKILPRRARSKKDTIDVSITLGEADHLLRKVWQNLEKACKQEGVKRYQMEACSVLSLVRKKPPSLFMKSRRLARELMEAEQKEERSCKSKKGSDRKKKIWKGRKKCTEFSKKQRQVMKT